MKALLTSFIAALYSMQILFGIAFVLLLADNRAAAEFAIAAAILGLVAGMLGLVNIAFAVLQIFLPQQPVFGSIMVAKLCLIPFFIIHFVFCLLIVAGFLNPFLAWSLLFVVPMMVGIAYAVLFVTSAYTIGYMIYRLRTKQTTLQAEIAYIIAHLVFVADTVASVMLCMRERKQSAQPSLPPPADVEIE
ncbi:MAG: hypothetical protein HFK10_03900 [Clostridia bacterium]|jgi:hypothetical protein|nr:hypothetical protein [Clostridia bacterium]